MPLFILVLLIGLPRAAAGGWAGLDVLTPPRLPTGASIRDVQLAADPTGPVTLALITDAGAARSGRGTFMARTVQAWQWNAQEWTPMGGVLNYDQPRPAANLNLTLDAAGTPVLAWNENYGDNDVVVFRAWNGTGWTNWKDRYLGISSPQAAKMRAVGAQAGAPVLLWGENARQGTGTALTLRRWQDGSWSRSPVLNSTRGDVRQPTLALGAAQQVTTAWVQGPIDSGQVVVQRDIGGTWEILGSPVSRHAGRYVTAPRLALGPANQVTLAWLEDQSGQDTLFAASWTGSRWVFLGGAVSTAFASSPTLTLDRAGRPVLAWVEDHAGTGQIHLARWTGQSWTQTGPLNLNPNRDARSPAVVVDRAGQLIVAWREDISGTYRLQLRRATN
ncbi:hypothetical protein GCM10010844_28720 [Deinococcus radiotolerans]|uniref:Uncharacterized protein n=2 Tax=Deinococcus radiotolerans TaxID=1309407 RepID=A0ABQ2FMY7_9DEIO|nr:hypothetical protein GCM10010844_28720 [Deinococcus radiotolerans]